MAKKIPRYRETKWEPDPTRWRGFMEKDTVKCRIPDAPKGGWQLWDWKTLEDKPQDVNFMHHAHSHTHP